jgi:hypothetical protein
MFIDHWETKLLNALSSTGLSPGLVAISILLAVASVLYYLHGSVQGKKQDDWTRQVTNSEVKNASSYKGLLKNIWDHTQTPSDSTGTASTTIHKTDSAGKPFGSSYYYAHNSLRKTGGYTDGLRMEDYQMETPRLLSKNGVCVKNQTPTTSAALHANPTLVEETSKAAASRKAIYYIPLTKYLWDDSNTEKAMGTIRIDHLTDDLSWKDASVTQVEVELKEEILLTVVVNTAENKKYRLQFKQLYGRVEQVKKVVKQDRLLIRLYKCRTKPDGRPDNENTKAWPTPYKKAF